MTTERISTNEAFAEFAILQQTRGLREALGYLLRLTDYRYIGIWRFQDGKADAAAHFDRENPQQIRAQEVPENATYCCFVRDSTAPFKTPHALMDERLAEHPARSQVQTYCGVPLMDSNGTLLGTLCHYDTEPRDVEQIDLRLMMMVASYLTLGGHVPPYPASAPAPAMAAPR